MPTTSWYNAPALKNESFCMCDVFNYTTRNMSITENSQSNADGDDDDDGGRACRECTRAKKTINNTSEQQTTTNSETRDCRSSIYVSALLSLGGRETKTNPKCQDSNDCFEAQRKLKLRATQLR